MGAAGFSFRVTEVDYKTNYGAAYECDWNAENTLMKIPVIVGRRRAQLPLLAAGASVSTAAGASAATISYVVAGKKQVQMYGTPLVGPNAPTPKFIWVTVLPASTH
jgi:hypothetical protein